MPNKINVKKIKIRKNYGKNYSKNKGITLNLSCMNLTNADFEKLNLFNFEKSNKCIL